jgi:hypothetical protein
MAFTLPLNYFLLHLLRSEPYSGLFGMNREVVELLRKRLNHFYLRYLKPPRPQRRLDATLVPIGGL